MANNRKFRRGQTVYLSRGDYPVRYLGRNAQIVGTETVGGRQRFLLDFSPRRETPLSVASSHIEVATD